MNGIGEKENKNIIVIGETNCPWEIRPALLRRFENKIYIPLPDLKTRIELIKKNLDKTTHNLTEEDFLEFGRATEGYSCSDIVVLVKDTMMEPIRKI